jgi:threonyl-tRNA synthetase
VQLDIIRNNVEDGAVISLYRSGPMVDLCRGPHVPNTGHIKAISVTNASRAFWRGDTTQDALQRVYGISFPDKKQMKGARRPVWTRLQLRPSTAPEHHSTPHTSSTSLHSVAGALQ